MSTQCITACEREQCCTPHNEGDFVEMHDHYQCAAAFWVSFSNAQNTAVGTLVGILTCFLV